MRKRIVIGVIAVVGIGVGAYVFSERKIGTVAYHQERYRAIYNDGQATRVEAIIMRFGPRRLKLAYFENRMRRLDSHRRAMGKHGDLVEKEFVLSSRTAREVAQRLQTAVHEMFAYSHDGFSYGVVNAVTTNKIVVIDTPKRMERWSDVISFIDVPETK